MLPSRVPPEQQLQLLSRINPNKFYAENVRSLLDISARQAQIICESAVRQNLFEKWVEVKCPDGSVGAEAASEDQLPVTTLCWHERDGDFESEELPTAQLRKNVFYRLHEKSAA